MAVDDEGYINVGDWGNERVQVLDPDGGFVTKLHGQATLSVWASRFIDSNPDEKRTREASNLYPDLPPVLSSPFHTSSQTSPTFSASRRCSSTTRTGSTWWIAAASASRYMRSGARDPLPSAPHVEEFEGRA